MAQREEGTVDRDCLIGFDTRRRLECRESRADCDEVGIWSVHCWDPPMFPSEAIATSTSVRKGLNVCS